MTTLLDVFAWDIGGPHMTKKELINILQMVYSVIPDCTCFEGYVDRGLVDPNCHRHAIYTEEQVTYIRMAVEGIAIRKAAQEIPIL